MEAMHHHVVAGHAQSPGHFCLPDTAAHADPNAQDWTDISALQQQQQSQMQQEHPQQPNEPQQVDQTQLALMQHEPPQQGMDPQATVLTPEQLATLTGALGGADIAALSGALGSNELLQRLIEAQPSAEGADPAAVAQQPAFSSELATAPQLVTGSYNDANAAAQDVLQAGGYAPQTPGDETHMQGATPVDIQQYQQHLPASGMGLATLDPAGMLPQQLQQQSDVRRKAVEQAEPAADSDVADILLQMAGDPKQQTAAAASAGNLHVDTLATASVHSAQQGTSDATEAPATAAPDVAGGHGEQVALAMPGSTVTDAAGNIFHLGGSLAGISAGMAGLPLAVQGLAGQQMLQISAADLSRLQGGMHAYAAQPGMQTLQLVQLPVQGGDLAALQQATSVEYAAGGDMGVQHEPPVGEDERPQKRARLDDEQQQQLGLGLPETGAAEGSGVDSATMIGAAGASGEQGLGLAGADATHHGVSEQQLTEQLQQQAVDTGAAAAAATALGTVVNVNGVNMLIPAAPQLQLQLAPDANNVQEQLLALQQQMHLAQIPVVAGLGGMQLQSIAAAGATPEQIQALQQQIQIQQQIQQLQLQQQLQIMQLQLSQQGIVLAPGARLTMESDASGHMVRRHGVLPERIVTRDMLKAVFHLPIEEAAKHLGIGQTMLKHYCRKFGIPRWPYRKRQSVVQLIASIESYAQDKPMAVEPALMKLRSFLNQIDEDPNIDLDGPIKRLRQAFFKEAYKARVRKGNDADSDGRGGRGGRGGGGGRTEAWLENLCQAIVDSHPDPPSGGHLTHHDGSYGGDMADADDGDFAVGTDELATVAALAAHSQHQHEAAAAAAAAAAATAGMDPSTLAASMAALGQLACMGGDMAAAAAAAAQQQQHGLDELQMAAAAAQAHAHAEQIAALQAAAAAAEQPHQQE